MCCWCVCVSFTLDRHSTNAVKLSVTSPSITPSDDWFSQSFNDTTAPDTWADPHYWYVACLLSAEHTGYLDLTLFSTKVPLSAVLYHAWLLQPSLTSMQHCTDNNNQTEWLIASLLLLELSMRRSLAGTHVVASTAAQAPNQTAPIDQAACSKLAELENCR